MTTKTSALKKPAGLAGIAARNIQAIWSRGHSANASQPAAPQGMSHKDFYCADRATD